MASYKQGYKMKPAPSAVAGGRGRQLDAAVNQSQTGRRRKSADEVRESQIVRR